MKVIFTLYCILILTSCSKERIAGEFDEEVQLSEGFIPTTTPIHISSSNLDIDECFYENNFVKLIAYDPQIKHYSWFKYDENQNIKLISNDSIILISKKGSYMLYAEYNIPDSALADANINIELSHCPTKVEVPSSFIPNDDGQFDTWFPLFFGVSDFYVRISNENSNILFESTSEENTFKGKFNNEKLPSGSYLYYISGTYRTGFVFEKQGVLELVR